MPRYFFHLDIGRQVVVDDDGLVLADAAAARREALLIARDFVQRRRGDLRRRWRGASIGVCDERDVTLFTLALAEASALGLAADLSRLEETEVTEASVVQLNGRLTREAKRRTRALVERSQAQTRAAPGSA